MIVPLSLAEANARLEPDRIGPRIRRRERWLSLHLQELRRRDAALQDLRRPPGDVPRLSLRARRRLRVRLRIHLSAGRARQVGSLGGGASTRLPRSRADESALSQLKSGTSCRRETSSFIASSAGRATKRRAASSTLGRSATSPTVFRKMPDRPSTQCTARSTSSWSRSGSYHVLAVCSRPSHGASVIALIVWTATPRSRQTDSSRSKSAA